MDRIASPRQLTSEIAKLLAYVRSTDRPERTRIAAELRALAERVAKKESFEEAKKRLLMGLSPKGYRVDLDRGTAKKRFPDGEHTVTFKTRDVLIDDEKFDIDVLGMQIDDFWRALGKEISKRAGDD